MVEGLPRLHQQQFLELRLRHDERACQLHFGHLEHLAFFEVHGDEDVVLLGSDGHLGGIDLEVGVAAIHVVVAQLLEVALQGLARVAVVLLVPGLPVRRLQLERIQHFLLFESAIADEVDLADLRALAFLDLDLDLHPVAGLLLNLRIHAHGVFSAAVVLVCQVLGDIFEHRAVKRLAGGKADIAQ